MSDRDGGALRGKAAEAFPLAFPDGACQTNVRYEYSYDGLNRLVHAQGSYDKAPLAPGMSSPPAPVGGDAPLTTVGGINKKFELGYDYAPNGNLTAKTIFNADTGAVDYQWNYSYSNHAVTGITASRSSAGYTMRYDAAGNMVSQINHCKNLAKEMAYDSYNRIRQITDPGNGNVKGKYWYDDQGFRVRKKARVEHEGREKEVETLSPSMYVTIEVASDLLGNVQNNTGYGVNNIYLNGVRVAAVLPTGKAQYYLTDQVDSVTVVLDDGGKIVTQHEYLPFGETWITEGDKKNSPRYNSQELDRETGYYFYNARHYDPEIARFVTGDSVVDGEIKDKNGIITYSDPQGWNKYAYCKVNPIIYKDPTGHLVDAVYDQKKGTLTIVDRDTKEKVTIKVESGGKPYGAHIPKGNFEILDHAKKDDRVGRRFRLDAVDEKPRNDKVESTGQTALRLHKPGRTTGCIAAADEKEWEKAKKLINNTKTVEVPDKSKPWWKSGGKDEKIKKFGELVVK